MPDKSRSPEMFDRISKTYDRTNRILSLGLDMRWRRFLARHLPQQSDRLLDVATGTGDQIRALLGQVQEAVGVDLSEEMLAIARRKLPQVRFERYNAEELPLPPASFDVCTLSFGIRNMQNPGKALRELHRVTRPGGRCLILEFSLPSQPVRTPYLFYLRHVVPAVGAFTSGDRTAYRYLNKTIEGFFTPSQFLPLLQETGWSAARAIPLLFGSVVLYIGDKP